MNRDDITRMAQESGGHQGEECEQCGETHLLWIFGTEELERFAALVAAAERERLAAKFMEMHNARQHRNNYFAFAARVIREEA
jgi:hypothetical protein